MLSRKVCAIAVLVSAAAAAQAGGDASVLRAPATLPILFSATIDAGHAHAGDAIEARTTQAVKLADGTMVRAGASVRGHVLVAHATAHEAKAELSIRFESVDAAGVSIPLRVTVRAMADPVTSDAARTPAASEMETRPTWTPIGTPIGAPSAAMRVSSLRQSGATAGYAPLVAHGRCDRSDVAVAVGVYSPAACGLYGFGDVDAAEMGSAARPSVLTLESTRTLPRIWKNSTALLEVLPAR